MKTIRSKYKFILIFAVPLTSVTLILLIFNQYRFNDAEIQELSYESIEFQTQFQYTDNWNVSEVKNCHEYMPGDHSCILIERDNFKIKLAYMDIDEAQGIGEISSNMWEKIQIFENKILRYNDFRPGEINDELYLDTFFIKELYQPPTQDAYGISYGTYNMTLPVGEKYLSIIITCESNKDLDATSKNQLLTEIDTVLNSLTFNQ